MPDYEDYYRSQGLVPNADGTEWVKLDQTPLPVQNPEATPADLAAYSIARGVKHSSKLPVRDDRGHPFGAINPEAPSYLMEPDLQEAQGGLTLPTNMYSDDAGQVYFNETNKPVPIVRRPGLLPLANTPEGIKLVMPKLLDVASNVMGNVGGKVTAKAGEMVLGSGMVRATEETAKAEPFYSQLERTVQQAKINLATPEQWLGYLKNQPGVKAEELTTVLGDLPKEGMLSKTQLEDIVKANKVELKEKVLGDPNNKSIMTPDSSRFDPYKIENANATRYHEYVLPGGEPRSYRETLLKLSTPQTEKFNKWYNKNWNPRGDTKFEDLPSYTKKDVAKDYQAETGLELPKTFKSSHWGDEEDVIAHSRTDERRLEGKIGTHIHELQSDLHQLGRKSGYKQKDIEQLKKTGEAIDEKLIASGREDVMGNPNLDEGLKLAVKDKIIIQKEADDYLRLVKNEHATVPDAPFKKIWEDLLLKRTIRDAVDKNHDFVSWTPGEANSTNPKILGSATEEQKEIADKGLRKFYNETLVNKANDIGKKYGSKVEQRELPHGKEYKIEPIEVKNRDGSKRTVYDVRFNQNGGEDRLIASYHTKEEATKKLNELKSIRGQSIHYLPITPELRAKAKEGFPLFTSVNPTLIPIDHDPFKDDKKPKVKLIPIQGSPVF